MCKIIITSELQHYSRNELSALFRNVSLELAQSEPDSNKRRNALASLENINRAIHTRQIHHLKLPGC